MPCYSLLTVPLGSVDDSNRSASAASSGGPLSEKMHRMKAVLGTLRKTVAWSHPHAEEYSTKSEDLGSDSQLSAHTGEHRGDLTRITMVLERLISSGMVHTIAKNLSQQLQDVLHCDNETPDGKSIPKLSSASHMVYNYAEEAIKNLLRPYLLPLVAQKSSEDAASTRFPALRTQSAQSCDPGKGTIPVVTHPGEMPVGTASQKRGEVLELFTKAMVHQVMDIVHEKSTLDLEGHQTHACPIAEQQTLGRSSPVASELGPDSTDFGCLVTILMLRLLAKLKDQQADSASAMISSRDLIQKVLSEFSDASGAPNLQAYQSNTKIQAIYRSMDKFLLKEFGPEAILQTVVETQDASFDNIFLMALGKELQHQNDTKAISVPPTLSAAPSFEPLTGTATGQTARKMPRIRLNIKVYM